MLDFFAKIEWSPGIGDPTFVGWFTVFAYLVCSFESYKVYKFGHRFLKSPIKRQRIFWLITSMLLLALGINKQLDLQSFFTASARYFALEQGWYDKRRELQQLFIAAVVGVGILGMATLVLFFAKVIRQQIFAVLGLGLVVVFVLVRATSFHLVDRAISMEIGGVSMNWILELSGIFLIYYGARRLLNSRKNFVERNSN